MKITLEEIKEFSEYIELAEELKPLVEQSAKSILGFGPILHDVVRRLLLGMADIEADVFDHYVKQRGLTREEALVLTVNVKDSFFKINIKK